MRNKKASHRFVYHYFKKYIMKKFTILVFVLFISVISQATTFNVTVSNFQFSPSNIPNVLVGDTIKFNFGGSNFHNVTTNSLGLVPAGAAAIFSGSPGSVTTSYSYTVTKAGSYRYYCEIHSSNGTTGMVGRFTASGVVPVQLKNFTAAYSNKVVSTTWQTASEQNLSYFAIQKSINGKDYIEAGRVNAKGSSDVLQSYSFRDENLDMNARYVYYMIKAVDKDGKFSLSSVKLIRNDAATKKLITNMAPNPVSKDVGHCMFQFNADRDGEMKAIVMDANGKTLMKLDMTAEKGINSGHIHMADLPTGIYTIIFSMDGLRETKRVVVTE
jgi:plastocyanin